MKRLMSLAFFLMLYGIPQWVMACPGCKNALETEKARGLAEGYFWSIMVLLGLPFFLTGFIAFMVYRGVQKRNKMLAHSVSSPA